jgi:hypothetical protein
MLPRNFSRINKPNQEEMEDPYIPSNIPFNRDTKLDPKNCLEAFFFTWINKIVDFGNKDPYEVRMLFKTNKMFEWGDQRVGFNQYLHKILIKPRKVKTRSPLDDTGRKFSTKDHSKADYVQVEKNF